MKAKIINVLIYLLMTLVSLFALAVNVAGLFQEGEQLPIGNQVAFIVAFSFVSVVALRSLIRGILQLKTARSQKE